MCGGDVSQIGTDRYYTSHGLSRDTRRPTRPDETPPAHERANTYGSNRRRVRRRRRRTFERRRSGPRCRAIDMPSVAAVAETFIFIRHTARSVLDSLPFPLPPLRLVTYEWWFNNIIWKRKKNLIKSIYVKVNKYEKKKK